MVTNKKKIAENTIMLYIRMALTMLVSLYTSRVVLNALGATDYGILNVVGGIVAMLSFFNSSITTSTQRFLNVGMTSKVGSNLINIFSSAINVHIIIAFITIILLETVGLWFLKNKLVIPVGQETTAIWVFQCSVISFFISIISAPYNAAIIAYEKMSAFALLSIIDCVIKLGCAIAIVNFGSNKLQLYATLIMFGAIFMRIAYGIYCKLELKDIKYNLYWNLEQIKQMMSFSGWLIFGCLADLLGTQGVNMLINIYFGPILNTARAIAVTVQNAVTQFYSSFSISVNPQITKSYAEGNYGNCYSLVLTSTKIILYLLLIVIIPIIIRTEEILILWLKIIPNYTTIIVKLILIDTLIKASYGPIAQVCFASGKVKKYQISIGVLFFIIFIGTYILFDLGKSIIFTFILSIIISAIGLVLRVLLINKIHKFPAKKYFCDVITRVIMIGVLSFVIGNYITGYYGESILYLLLTAVTTTIITLVIISLFGLNKSEKFLLKKGLKQITNKLYR